MIIKNLMDRIAF